MPFDSVECYVDCHILDPIPTMSGSIGRVNPSNQSSAIHINPVIRFGHGRIGWCIRKVGHTSAAVADMIDHTMSVLSDGMSGLSEHLGSPEPIEPHSTVVA